MNTWLSSKAVRSQDLSTNRGFSDSTDRFLRLLKCLHSALSFSHFLEAADQIHEEAGSLSAVWIGHHVNFPSNAQTVGGTEKAAVRLTYRRASICAIMKTTKVSNLGKTDDITCEPPFLSPCPPLRHLFLASSPPFLAIDLKLIVYLADDMTQLMIWTA